jgi:hypothetical protein
MAPEYFPVNDPGVRICSYMECYKSRDGNCLAGLLAQHKPRYLSAPQLVAGVPGE